jgi:hypothetical protein
MWIAEVHQQAANMGEVRMLYGRRRCLPNIYLASIGDAAEARRQPQPRVPPAALQNRPSGLPNRGYSKKTIRLVPPLLVVQHAAAQ